MRKNLRHQGEPYAYCESVAAYRWHIRKLDKRGLKPSGIGGEPAFSLCGMEMAWDIDVVLEPIFPDVCARCRAKFSALQRRHEEFPEVMR